MNGWDYRVHSGAHGASETAIVPRFEAPVLSFADYAVAFHLAATAPEGSAPEPSGQAAPSLEERALESYERDMLLYAYRHVAPLVTHPLGKRSRVTVDFPPELVFESEGSPIRLTCSGAGQDGRKRRTTLLASKTTFYRSKMTVVTLVLRPPLSRSRRSRLNEYDVIKLAKLWEGGEGLPEPGSPTEENGPVTFADGSGKMDLQALVRQIAGRGWSFPEYHSGELASAIGTPGAEGRPSDDDSRRHYRAGTIVLKLRAIDENAQLLTDARAAKEGDDSRPEYGSLRWRRVVALGGLIQGLLDFEEIGPAELSDVFAESELDDESLLAFHKGTLLSVSLEGSSQEEERDAQLGRPIGMSPYLAIPHVTLLHNELRLKSALIKVDELLRGQERADPLLPVLRRYLSLVDRHIPLGVRGISIEKTEAGIREVSEGLARHLPNIFHYESERGLYDDGTKSRGFGDFEPLIKARLGELQGTLESRVRQRDNWTLGLTIAFFAVAALQLALGSVTLWVSLPLLAALAVVVWLLRRRLF